MTARSAVLAAALLTCVPAITRADATTQPIDPVAQKLVAQLGDENPKVRDAAAAALRRLGKSALPALQAAAHDPDVQVRASSRGLADEMLRPPRPVTHADVDTYHALGNGRIRVLNGGRLQINNLQINNPQVAGQLGGNLQIMNLNVVGGGNGVAAVRDVSVNVPGGGKIHVREDKDGITVDLPGDNGATKQFKAKTADELKKDAPEAFRAYEKYMLAGPWGGLKIEVGQ